MGNSSAFFCAFSKSYLNASLRGTKQSPISVAAMQIRSVKLGIASCLAMTWFLWLLHCRRFSGSVTCDSISLKLKA